MVDRNSLNRIKGILSARKGAEIPKYKTGDKIALPVFNPGDPSFQQWRSKAASASSNYMTAWRDYSILKSEFPTASIDDLASYMESGVGPGGVTLDSLYGKYTDAVSTTGSTPQQSSIPGANPAEGNPAAAVTSAAATNATIAAGKDSQVVAQAVQAQQASTPTPAETKVNSNPNGQTPEVIVSKPTEQNPSAGLNLTPEQAAELKKAQGWGIAGQAVSGVFNAVGDAVGAKQAATDSNTTKTADAVYDGIAGAVENMGPVGKVVGTAMKAAGVAGDLIQEMGGGTDQQTKMDQWMDSSFFSWNIGMLNGFAGKNSDSFGIDQDTVAQVGSSYGGTVDDLNDAASKAGKKYGLFSSKARKKANEAIATAKTRQNLMGNIADTASDQRLAVQSMGEQAGLAYSMMTSGGYNQKFTYAAKHGGMLEWNPVATLEWEPQVELNWELQTFKDGGNIELVEELEWTPNSENEKFSSFEEWFQSIPKKYRASGYDYKKAYEVLDLEVLRKHAKDPKNNHLQSVSPVADENGNYPFLKLGKLEENPELQGEFNWYNSEDGKEHRSKFDIQFIGDRYYYVPKKLKKGGSVGDSEIPETEETAQKNVIPEGALHKNKHHMEHAAGLTKKGIPVIDDEGEQQAEIEHSEIIFTLEVTKKLEEYYEIFYSDESSNKEKEQAAIDAGKLLVFQILENTEDRTGLIESCKKGGSLTLKTTTDDLIEEVLEWIPTVVIVEEKEVEEKPKKKEEKSDKELMKEAIKEVLIELLTK